MKTHKLFFAVILLTFFVFGCNKNQTSDAEKSALELSELELKEKEIEMKNRELELKEKELADNRERELEEREKRIAERERSLEKRNEQRTIETRTSSGQLGRFPQASSRKLTSADVSNLDGTELRIMRNEIFARYGYKFKTPEMRNYFMKTSWYTPLYDNVDKMLTATEKANVELILRYEKNYGNYNYGYSR